MYFDAIELSKCVRDLQQVLDKMGSHLVACFWKCCPKFPFVRIPIFMVLSLQPFQIPIQANTKDFSLKTPHLTTFETFGDQTFPFYRIPIFTVLCLFSVLVSDSHLFEFPFYREPTVRGYAFCPLGAFSKNRPFDIRGFQSVLPTTTNVTTGC